MLKVRISEPADYGDLYAPVQLGGGLAKAAKEPPRQAVIEFMPRRCPPARRRWRVAARRASWRWWGSSDVTLRS